MTLGSNELFQQILLKICPSFVVFQSGTFFPLSVQKKRVGYLVPLSIFQPETSHLQSTILSSVTGDGFTHGLIVQISPLNLKFRNAPTLQFCACSLHQLSFWEKLKSLPSEEGQMELGLSSLEKKNLRGISPMSTNT